MKTTYKITGTALVEVSDTCTCAALGAPIDGHEHWCGMDLVSFVYYSDDRRNPDVDYHPPYLSVPIGWDFSEIDRPIPYT